MKISKIFHVAAQKLLNGTEYNDVETVRTPRGSVFAQAVFEDDSEIIPSDELYIAHIVDGGVVAQAPLLRNDTEQNFEDAVRDIKHGENGFFKKIDEVKK